jgi:hydroxypyruvate reductase
MKPSQFLTETLRTSPHGEAVCRVLAAAINAVEPGAAVNRHMSRSGSKLTIAGKTYDLDAYRRVLVFGFGKASVPMCNAATNMLGDRFAKGIAITKTSATNDHPHLEVFTAAHPVPDESGVRAAKRILDVLASTAEDDLVIFLISGGGSALLTAPANGISLDDVQATTEILLASGADITAINTVRKHLSEVKGGNLARHAHPAETIALILSDVIGDPLDMIASGPTVPDPSTYAQALAILQDKEGIPRPVSRHLRRGAEGKIPETPKPGDPIFERVSNVLIGNNHRAAQAAARQAGEEGFNSLLLTTRLQGEARTIGPVLAAIGGQIVASDEPVPRPACVIAGGETTVTLSHNPGLGGRNQEVALSAVNNLAGLEDILLVTLATDGDDGPSDAAGAVVSGETLRRAKALALDPADFLARNDSYDFFEPLGDLLRPGPTKTNVNDLNFLFVFK